MKYQQVAFNLYSKTTNHFQKELKKQVEIQQGIISFNLDIYNSYADMNAKGVLDLQEEMHYHLSNVLIAKTRMDELLKELL